MAADDSGFLMIVRLEAGASEPSRVSIETEGWVVRAIVDPFGDVVAAWLDREDALCVMRYDGRSGRPHWREPARTGSWPAGTERNLQLDPRGDLVLFGGRRDDPSNPLQVLKLCGKDGRVAWGPFPLLGPGEGTSYGAIARVDRAGGLLVITAPYGAAARLIRLDLSDGRRLWSTTAPELSLGYPAADSPEICVTAGAIGQESDLVAFRLRDGARLWARRLPAAIESVCDQAPGTLFVVTRGVTRQVWKLSLSSGKTLWGPVNSPVGGPYGGSQTSPGRMLVDGSGNLLVSGTGESFVGPSLPLVKHDGRTGELLWSVRSPSGGYPGALLSTLGRGCTIVGAGITLARFDDLGQRVGNPVYASGLQAQLGPTNAKAVLAGAVLVTGEADDGSWSVPGCPRRLIGRDPGSGRVLWTREEGAGFLTDLIRDPANNVLSLWDDRIEAPPGRAFRALKLQPSDGAVLWSSALTATDGGTWAAAMAVDPFSTDVFVALTGPSPSTWRLDGRSGAVLAGPVRLPLQPSQVLCSGDRLLVVGEAFDALAVVALDARGLLPIWGPLLEPGEAYRPARATLDASGNLHLAVGRNDDKVETTYLAVDSASGRRLVKATLPGVADPFGVYVDARERPVLVTDAPTIAVMSLDATSGAPRWGPVPFPDGARLAFDEGSILVFSAPSSSWSLPPSPYLSALDAETGQQRWRVELSHSLLARGASAEPAALIVNGGDLFLLEGLADGTRLLRLTTELSLLEPRIEGIPCGVWVRLQLQAEGGQPPYRFDVVAGGLPEGLTLSAEGVLEGLARSAGARAVTLRVRDSAGLSLERDLVVDVVGSLPDVALAGGFLTLCRGVPSTLDAPAPFASPYWLPFGERGTRVSFVPEEPMSIVVTDDGGGCPRRASLTLEIADPDSPPFVLAPPSLVVIQNACAGGRPGALGQRSSELSGFLSGGSARAACTPISRRLGVVEEGGAPVGTETFLDVGTHHLDFRFEDTQGRVGEGRTDLHVLLLGDASGGGRLDELDLLYLADYLVSSRLPGAAFGTEPDLRQLDVDRNGRIDVFDLVVLSNHLVGNIGCLTP